MRRSILKYGQRRAVHAVVVSAVLAIGSFTPTSAQDESEGLSIVVTTEVLGAIVRDLAPDDSSIIVLMDGGADPHTWQPSARDGEAIFEADLVVANGLGLEEGLVQVLEQAESEGVQLFTAGDHIGILATAAEHAHADEADHAEHAHADEADHAEHAHADEADHAEHGPNDPHFWLDPRAMNDVVVALAPVLTEVGVDVSDRVTDVVEDLDALDAEVASILADIPANHRRLVTGHEALGYFADRYGFEVIGTVIPSLSTGGEVSARDVAALVETLRAEGSTAIFVDVATPPAVASALATETGAKLVELKVAQLPEDGTYAGLLRTLATAVADALTD